MKEILHFRIVVSLGQQKYAHKSEFSDSGSLNDSGYTLYIHCCHYMYTCILFIYLLSINICVKSSPMCMCTKSTCNCCS